MDNFDYARFIRHCDIKDKNGRPLRIYDDGYRIYAKWTSRLPLNGPAEPELIMEYKYCNYPALAEAVIDLLMKNGNEF